MLGIETFFGPVENVIGRNRDERHAGLAACQRQEFRPERVGSHRAIAISLATVNVGPGSTVDKRVRPLRSHGIFNRPFVSYIECGVIEGGHRLAVSGEG